MHIFHMVQDIDNIQKVVIMPLDGDDDAGVFAIMIPQTTDRSLHGLQSYRPYEVRPTSTTGTWKTH